jgi:hypothetical protein
MVVAGTGIHGGTVIRIPGCTFLSDSDIMTGGTGAARLGLGGTIHGVMIGITPVIGGLTGMVGIPATTIHIILIRMFIGIENEIPNDGILAGAVPMEAAISVRPTAPVEEAASPNQSPRPMAGATMVIIGAFVAMASPPPYRAAISLQQLRIGSEQPQMTAGGGRNA